MSLGQQLKQARLRMNLTASEVASATRMKVQIVESIEDENFSVFAAPIYGKGFIRMYAEYVGLDPVPLMQEYALNYTRSAPVEPGQVLKSEEKVSEPDPANRGKQGWRNKFFKSASAEDAEFPEEQSARAGKQFDLFNDLEEPEPVEQAIPVERKSSGEVPASDAADIEPVAGVSPVAEPEMPAVDDEPPAQSSDFVSRLKSGLSALVRILPLGREPESESDETVALNRKGQWAVIGVGILVILLFLMSGLSRCVRPSQPEGDRLSEEGISLGIDMPQPFFD